MIKFGTSGFRSKIGEGFTKENIQKIAQALSRVIKSEKSKNPVIVGYDRRFLSDSGAQWFAEVLNGNKIKVKIYNRPVPTPAVMFGVQNENLDYGVRITASHNPYYDNGLKIIVKGGADASNETVEKIEKLANSNLKVKSMVSKIAKEKQLLEDYDNMKDYLKNLNKFVSRNIRENKIKVLFNAMHGACSEYAPMLAKMYKINKFDVINDSIDAYFENKLPAPEEDNLENFKKQVVRGKYSIGLAVDGDGDRLAVIDENGVFHNNNDLMALGYYYLVKYRNFQGDIVRNISNSTILNKLADAFGYKCHETPTGFKYTSRKMQEVDALLGGEFSGGMTMRDYIPSKDSLFSTSLILDAMINIGKPLSQIFNEVKEFCGYTGTYISNSIVVPNKNKMQKALKRQAPAFSYKPVQKLKIDGTKYIFEDGSWVLLRFSGTENVLRYYMEFSTEIECERNLKAVQNYIEKFGN